MDVMHPIDEPVSAAAIAVALRLAERGVRTWGRRSLDHDTLAEECIEVYSTDGCRSVRFTPLPGGEVRVTHAVWRWVRGPHYQSQKWGTERVTILAAGDARAVRALALIERLPAGGLAEPARSHGS